LGCAREGDFEIPSFKDWGRGEGERGEREGAFGMNEWGGRCMKAERR
jgi:hypothetical protein